MIELKWIARDPRTAPRVIIRVNRNTSSLIGRFPHRSRGDDAAREASSRVLSPALDPSSLPLLSSFFSSNLRAIYHAAAPHFFPTPKLN